MTETAEYALRQNSILQARINLLEAAIRQALPNIPEHPAAIHETCQHAYCILKRAMEAPAYV